MRNRGVSVIRWFLGFALLGTVFIAQPSILSGEISSPEHRLHIEISNKSASIDARDAKVTQILREFQQRFGIPVRFGDSIIRDKITVQFKNLNFESAFTEILNRSSGFYVLTFSRPEEKGKNILTEIFAEGGVVGTRPFQGRMITVDILYGSGTEEIGTVDEGLGSSGGLTSFTVDEKGNIYVCDPANSRVQVYSAHGEYLFGVPLAKEIVPADISTDTYGFVYIYDEASGKVLQYEKNGHVRSSAEVPLRTLKNSGPMKMAGNGLFVETCLQVNECGYALLAKLSPDNLLVSVPGDQGQELKPLYMGAGSQGRSYLIESPNDERKTVRIREQDGSTSSIFSFAQRGIKSMKVCGEDTEGDIFVRTQRADFHGDTETEVHRFAPDGKYVSTIRIPEGDYYFRVMKEFELGRDGSLYNFIPEKEVLRIHIFSH